MQAEAEVLTAERTFFTGLTTSNVAALEQVLADDFVLIDVMGGSEIPRSDLLGAIGAGLLKFNTVEHLDSRVRLYGSTAVVTGSTRMQGRFQEMPFQAHSRYTHVYVAQEGRWQLVAAQGTQIAPVL